MHTVNLHYIIFDMIEVRTIDFSEVLETSIETLRISLDGIKSFVKYEGAMPSSIMDLTTRSIEYSNEEILTILESDKWSDYSILIT
tara:strand:- start:45 stop:302 length:258 start_codon:yes stop_codon:yes gene_type:complete